MSKLTLDRVADMLINASGTSSKERKKRIRLIVSESFSELVKIEIDNYKKSVNEKINDNNTN